MMIVAKKLLNLLLQVLVLVSITVVANGKEKEDEAKQFSKTIASSDNSNKFFVVP